MQSKNILQNSIALYKSLKDKFPQLPDLLYQQYSEFSIGTLIIENIPMISSQGFGVHLMIMQIIQKKAPKKQVVQLINKLNKISNILDKSHYLNLWIKITSYALFLHYEQYDAALNYFWKWDRDFIEIFSCSSKTQKIIALGDSKPIQRFFQGKWDAIQNKYRSKIYENKQIYSIKHYQVLNEEKMSPSLKKRKKNQSEELQDMRIIYFIIQAIHEPLKVSQFQFIWENKFAKDQENLKQKMLIKEISESSDPILPEKYKIINEFQRLKPHEKSEKIENYKRKGLLFKEQNIHIFHTLSHDEEEFVQKDSLQNVIDKIYTKKNVIVCKDTLTKEQFMKLQKRDYQIIIEEIEIKNISKLKEEKTQRFHTQSYLICKLNQIIDLLQFDLLQFSRIYCLKDGDGNSPNFDFLDTITFFQQYSEIDKELEKIISSNNIVPNFSMVTENSTSFLENTISLFWLANPHHRQNSINDSLTLLQEASKKQFCTQQYTFQKFKTEFLSGKINLLQWYSYQTFFYKILNKSLRKLYHPGQMCYLRGVFYHIFWDIEKLFYQQANQQFRKSDITCYRGCRISEEQFKMLQRNINGYLQMKGFLSTSTNSSTAQAYAQIGNCLLTIRIPKIPQECVLFSGFADISKLSQYPNEKQILFSVLNYFKIIKCSKQDKIFKITLEFTIVSEKQKKQVSDYDSYLIKNYYQHKDFKNKICSQADCLAQMSLLKESYDCSLQMFASKIKASKTIPKLQKQYKIPPKLIGDVCGKLPQNINKQLVIQYFNHVIQEQSIDCEGIIWKMAENLFKDNNKFCIELYQLEIQKRQYLMSQLQKQKKNIQREINLRKKLWTMQINKNLILLHTDKKGSKEYIQNIQKSKEEIEQYREQLISLKNIPNEAKVQIQKLLATVILSLGSAFGKIMDLEKLQQYCNLYENIQLPIFARNWREEAVHYSTLATLLSTKGCHSKALHYLGQSDKINDYIGHNSRYVINIFNAAQMYINCGYYDKAKGKITEAIKYIHIYSSNQIFQCELLRIIVGYYLCLEKFQKAYLYSQRNLKVAHIAYRQQHRSQALAYAGVLYHISNCCKQNGQYDLAKKYMKDVQSTFNIEGHFCYINYWISIKEEADIQFRLKNYDEAEPLLIKCCQNFKRLQIRQRIQYIHALILLSKIYMLKQQWSKAKMVLEQILNLKDKATFKYYEQAKELLNKIKQLN